MAPTPGHVARWRRRPAYWLVGMIAVWGLLIWTNADDAQADRVDYLGAPTVTAIVTARNTWWETIGIRYVDPTTGFAVERTIDVWDSELFPGASGDTVDVELAPGTRREARVVGDQIEFSWEVELAALLILPMLTWTALRWWFVGATRRLIVAEQPAYEMSIRLVGRGWYRPRPYAELRPIDGAEQPEPICTVPLVPGDGFPLVGDRCVVKGSPRPFGHVVLRGTGGALWPSGRAIGWSRRRSPEGSHSPPVIRPLPLGVQPRAALEVMAVVTVLCAGASLAGAAFGHVAWAVTFGSAALLTWRTRSRLRGRWALAELSAGRTDLCGVPRLGGFRLRNGRLWVEPPPGWPRRQRLRFEPEGLVVVCGRRETTLPWWGYGSPEHPNSWEASLEPAWHSWWLYRGWTRDPVHTRSVLTIRARRPVPLGRWSRRRVRISVFDVRTDTQAAVIALIEAVAADRRRQVLLEDQRALTVLLCSFVSSSHLTPMDDRSNPWPPHLFIGRRIPRWARW